MLQKHWMQNYLARLYFLGTGKRTAIYFSNYKLLFKQQILRLNYAAGKSQEEDKTKK